MAGWRRRSFARDTRGATAIEFAILAPIFFAILAAILQTSIQYFAAQVLESAVQDTSRTIRVGQVQREGWTVADYKKNVCGRLFGFFGDCADLRVNVRQIDDFKSATYSIPLDQSCKQDCKWTEDDVWTPGVASSVVLVQVFYRYPSIVPVPFVTNDLPDGRRLLGAATIFRNEPF